MIVPLCNIIVRIPLIILIFGIFIGCSDYSEQNEADVQIPINDETFASVTDTGWSLTYYQRENDQVNDVLDGSRYLFNINSSINNVTGVFDCNEYSSSYSFDNTVLRFGALEIDAAICEHNDDAPYEKQNNDVSYLFQNDMYLVKSSDMLIVRNIHNDEYVFQSISTQVNSIEGVNWNLISYANGSGNPTSLIPGTSYSFRLDRQSSRASGMFDCNAISAAYSLDGMSIQFGEIESDGQDCTLDIHGYKQQSSFVDLLLTRLLAVTFEDEKLILTDDEDNYLVFSKSI